MRATFFSKALNFFDSPTRSARSIRDIEATVARDREPAGASSSGDPRLLRLSGFPALAALVAVLLDLPREGLGDLRLLDGRVALLPQHDLHLGQRRDLPSDLGKLLLNPRSQLLVDSGAAAALHLDAHPPS